MLPHSDSEGLDLVVLMESTHFLLEDPLCLNLVLQMGRSCKIDSVSGSGSSWLGSDTSEEIKEGSGG